MQQIWTNPSHERSFIQSGLTKAETVECLQLISSGSTGNKTIMIFPDMEYNFIFYDAKTGEVRQLTGLVTKVYPDQIKVKYVNKPTDVDCSKCPHPCGKQNNTSMVPPMPTCNCVLNPPSTEKYDDPKVYFIPIANLIGVSYIITKPDQPDKRKETHVMLLGISATMVKAIIVRLEFFDDAIEDAVKLVEMEAGGVYDIAYEGKDGTIYESRVKVMKIEECEPHPPIKPGKGFVRENVGGDNVIYTSCCDYNHNKNDFMNEPPAPMVKIVVDTSEDFHGRYEVILLHTIRDCTLVQAPDGSTNTPEVETNSCTYCEFKSESCNPENCGHWLPPKHPDHCHHHEVYTYTYDNMMKAIVDGDHVSLFIKGEKTDLNLESLVKYYLGVE